MDLRIVARGPGSACLSDKAVDRVVGSAVRFLDGGWADARSRRYRGCAPGRVFFVSIPEELPWRGGRVVDDLVALSIRGSDADVIVSGGADESATIEIHGDPRFRDAVNVEDAGGEGRIRWYSGNIARAIDGTRQVRCSVPDRTPVAIDAHGGGRWWISVPVRDLQAAIGGTTELVCDKVDGLDIELNDDARAFVANASGSARLRVNGAGSVVLAAGAIDRVDAVVRGSGSVVVEAAVGEATIAEVGRGAAVIPQVSGMRSQQHRGPGPVLVAPPAG